MRGFRRTFSASGVDASFKRRVWQGLVPATYVLPSRAPKTGSRMCSQELSRRFHGLPALTSLVTPYMTPACSFSTRSTVHGIEQEASDSDSVTPKQDGCRLDKPSDGGAGEDCEIDSTGSGEGANDVENKEVSLIEGGGVMSKAQRRVASSRAYYQKNRVQILAKARRRRQFDSHNAKIKAHGGPGLVFDKFSVYDVVEYFQSTKVQNLKVFDIAGRSHFTEFWVVGTGPNMAALRHWGGELHRTRRKTYKFAQIDGAKRGQDDGWVIVDLGPVWVHLFTEAARLEHTRVEQNIKEHEIAIEDLPTLRAMLDDRVVTVNA